MTSAPSTATAAHDLASVPHNLGMKIAWRPVRVRFPAATVPRPAEDRRSMIRVRRRTADAARAGSRHRCAQPRRSRGPAAQARGRRAPLPLAVRAPRSRWTTRSARCSRRLRGRPAGADAGSGLGPRGGAHADCPVRGGHRRDRAGHPDGSPGWGPVLAGQRDQRAVEPPSPSRTSIPGACLLRQPGQDRRPRIQTVLGRQVPGRTMEWLEKERVFSELYRSAKAIHLDLPGMALSRMAIAVRAGNDILGSMWAAVSRPAIPGPGAGIHRCRQAGCTAHAARAGGRRRGTQATHRARGNGAGRRPGRARSRAAAAYRLDPLGGPRAGSR